MHPISSFKRLLWQATVLTGFLSLRLLLVQNLGSSSWNEVDVLPLARHYADPSWLSQDWYLSQAGGYRLLFEFTVGWLVVTYGFLATSIIGRLCCYGLVAIGLVLIGQQLRLSLPFLLLATIFFAGQGVIQGAIAGEWMVGGLEAKAVAYGLILIAVALMLSGRYLGMTLLLGLATSFHVLVGGWAFLTTLGWFCLRPSHRLSKLKEMYLLLLLLYVAASAFALPAVVQQLSASSPESAIAPAYIYVFLRLPHHLNPLSWHWLFWTKPIVCLLLLGASMVQIKRQANLQGWLAAHFARLGLAEFALVSLIPFIGGLAIAPFDSQGQWLQYYPFRFADVMLPLTACLLVACVLESRLGGKHLSRLCVILLFIVGVQTALFTQELLALRQFPSEQQAVDPQWKVMSEWIRFHTPKDATIVSDPVQLANFTLLTERSTIAKFKLFPQTQAQILEQYERLDDLSGNQVSAYLDKGKVNKPETMQVLSTGFEQLNTSQAEALMNKYHASYFLTNLEHDLNLEVAYRCDPYILYAKS